MTVYFQEDVAVLEPCTEATMEHVENIIYGKNIELKPTT